MAELICQSEGSERSVVVVVMQPVHLLMRVSLRHNMKLWWKPPRCPSNMISTVTKSFSLAIYGSESEDSSQAAPVIVSSPQGASVCH